MQPKPGYQTSEFWTHLALSAATLLGQMGGLIPAPWGVAAAAVSQCVYTVARSALKTAAPVLALVALLGLPGVARAQCFAGSQIGVVCAGPTGDQSACPGEPVRCEVEAVNFGCTPLLLVDAGVVFHAPAGDEGAELTTTMPAGIVLPNEGDSASFAFVVPAPSAPAGTRIEMTGSTLIVNLAAPTAGPASSSFGAFLDIRSDCTVPRSVAAQALREHCRCRTVKRRGTPAQVCRRCRL